MLSDKDDTYVGDNPYEKQPPLPKKGKLKGGLDGYC